MKNKKFTSSEFHEYLIMHQLFRSKIWNDTKGFYAIVNKMPELGLFTKIKQLSKHRFEVYLTFKDAKELHEPNSFFL